MDQLTAFDRHFIHLVLEIDKHLNGYIDSYIGPAAFKEAATLRPSRPAVQLLDDVRRLQDTIPAEAASRRLYLAATLRAIETTVQILNGEDIPYMEEVQRLYDIMPQKVDDARFVEAHKELDGALPGSGALNDRLEAWRAQYYVPKEKLLPALRLLAGEVSKRTKALVDLPPGESVTIELVDGQPWNAYNWFKGQGQSLIEINTDMPSSAFSLLSLIAHEGYPGHHTESALKEARYWRNGRHGEAAAMLLHSPAAVIAEGIATTAMEIIFPDGEHLRWNLEVLLPAISLTAQESAAQISRIEEAVQRLRAVSGNAAMLYHTRQLDRRQTADYLRTYGLGTPERAEKSLAFITHPLYRSYIFTYTEGYDLMARAAGGTDKSEPFLNCLTGQVLPSQLAAQAARVAGDE